jgi:hypothetical protein
MGTVPIPDSAEHMDLGRTTNPELMALDGPAREAPAPDSARLGVRAPLGLGPNRLD